jgi:DNA helicase-2/ATP-dependent DNA helicase PcrA
VTFTKKAAQEMRERISDAAGLSGESITISTFHSLGLSMLRDHPEAFGLEQGFSIWDDKSQNAEIKRILKEVYQTKKGGHLTNSPPAQKDILARYDQLRRTATKRDHLVTHMKTMPGSGWRVVELYEEAKRACNAVDFGDLLYLAFWGLKNNPSVLKAYQERWNFVMVDEYQDTNQIQELIIGLLAGGHRNLMVVGDEDQAIYGFRGSEVEHILNFKQRWPDAVEIKLGKNYRCSSAILDAAACCIRNNLDRRFKSLEAHKAQGWPVEYQDCGDQWDEAFYIAAAIKGSLAAGYPAEEHAILCRTRRQMRFIQGELRSFEIPYQLVGGTDIFGKVDVRLLLAWFSAFINRRDLAAGSRILLAWPKVGAKTVLKWRSAAATHEGDMWQGLHWLVNPKTKQGQQLKALQGTLRGMEEMAHHLSLARMIDWVYGQTGMFDEIYALTHSPEPSEIKEGEARDADREMLLHLAQGIGSGNTADDIIGFLDLLCEAKGDTEETRVVLSTIHSAKGREWDHVWVPGMNEGTLPIAVRDALPNIEEERRLAYVAMTRAKQRLTLTWSETQGGDVKDPSRFVAESRQLSERNLEVIPF